VTSLVGVTTSGNDVAAHGKHPGQPGPVPCRPRRRWPVIRCRPHRTVGIGERLVHQVSRWVAGGQGGALCCGRRGRALRRAGAARARRWQRGNRRCRRDDRRRREDLHNVVRTTAVLESSPMSGPMLGCPLRLEGRCPLPPRLRTVRRPMRRVPLHSLRHGRITRGRRKRGTRLAGRRTAYEETSRGPPPPCCCPDARQPRCRRPSSSPPGRMPSMPMAPNWAAQPVRPPQSNGGSYPDQSWPSRPIASNGSYHGPRARPDP
jgi:hypothetical protein